MAVTSRMLVCLALLCLAVVKGQDIILLGDSLSDNGNGYAGTTKFVLQTNETYPQAPYYQGRWSNGPSWIEIAARQLGVNLTDYGAAGATTGVVPAQVPPLQPPFAGLTVPTTVLSPTLGQQLNSLLLQTSNVLSPDPIYIVFIGVNDYISTVLANSTNTAQQTFNNIQLVVSKLYGQGARKFVIASIPAISGLPVFTQPQTYGFYPNASVQNLDKLTMSQNMLQQQFVNNVPSMYPGASASYFDWGGALMMIQQNAAAYGITNLMQACYVTAPNLAANSVPFAQPIGAAGGTLCPDPDAHFFWDQFHPTRVVHEFIGAEFTQQFSSSLFGGKGSSPSQSPSQSPATAPSLPTLPFLSTQAAGR